MTPRLGPKPPNGLVPKATFPDGIDAAHPPNEKTLGLDVIPPDSFNGKCGIGLPFGTGISDCAVACVPNPLCSRINCCRK